MKLSNMTQIHMGSMTGTFYGSNMGSNLWHDSAHVISVILGINPN
jgi:hypothetical protein